MKVVAVLGQKGGVGKSTLSAHLAVAAHHMGHVVGIVDADPQGTLRFWSERRSARGETEPTVVAETTPGFLERTVKRFGDAGASLVFVDVAGRAEAMADRAARLADLVLVPSRPSLVDMDAVPVTADLLARLDKDYYVIINDLDVRGGTTDEAQALDAFRAQGIKVGADVGAPNVAHRKAFRASFISGQTAQEIEPTGKARSEIDALYSWVCDRLRIPAEGEYSA